MATAEAAARAKLESIKKMVTALDTEDKDAKEEALQTIHKHPLSVGLRSDWVNPGQPFKASEYRILLSTGGPACRIIGELDRGEPFSARLQYLGSFTPWTEYMLTVGDRDVLLEYVRQVLS